MICSNSFTNNNKLFTCPFDYKKCGSGESSNGQLSVGLD